MNANEDVIDPRLAQNNEINPTASPILPVIATPTRSDLENDYRNFLNFSTPGPLLNSLTPGPFLNFSTPGIVETDDSMTESIDTDFSELSMNVTAEPVLGPDSTNAMDILKKIRIRLDGYSEPYFLVS